jgi:hypothetical protein
MKITRNLILLAWLATTALANDDWQNALREMPLGISQGGVELDRTNCVPLMLNAFQSNGVVKALIFMPGATDEFYFFRRARATLTNSNPTLFDAVVALTNQTYIQVTFQPPLLLLHTTEDALDGFATVKKESTATKLRQRIVPDRLVFNDVDWGRLRSALNKKLGVGLRPDPGALETWHFYRHSFAACGVSQWELLESIALAGKTTFQLNWLTAEFQPDARSGVVPKLENFPGR